MTVHEVTISKGTILERLQFHLGQSFNENTQKPKYLQN